MADFVSGPQNNLAGVVHALRRNEGLLLRDAIPLGKDLLAAYGPHLPALGGEIRGCMKTLEIDWGDIASQDDLIALIELTTK